MDRGSNTGLQAVHPIGRLEPCAEPSAARGFFFLRCGAPPSTPPLHSVVGRILASHALLPAGGGPSGPVPAYTAARR